MDNAAAASEVAVDSAVQTILVVLGGAYLAYREVIEKQYLSPEATSSLSKATIHLVLPCLVFELTIQNINFSTLDVVCLVLAFVICKS
jgi:predicted permease